MSRTSGYIFDIQRFSIHDGPGIRTTVFFLGCPLRCLWCHNPEGMSDKPVLSFIPDKCIGCGYCLRACRRGAHRMEDGRGHVLDRELCVACGDCTKECYSGALELVGREVSAGEVLNEVLRDRPFYETSGGGMTLSGGEPLVQINFAESLLRAAKSAGTNCVVETCGNVEYRRLERVRPYVDLFLYDIKETHPLRHSQYTGADNDMILGNLRSLHDAGADILIRLPIVPGYNDRKDHFEAIARLCRNLPLLRGVEILPYHRLGISKRERLGLHQAGLDVEPPAAETVEQWNATLRGLGMRVLDGAETTK